MSSLGVLAEGMVLAGAIALLAALLPMHQIMVQLPGGQVSRAGP